ncbi:MAG: hypothetical protein HY700_07355 [Gemmatimonadetes bacterium]|nr:hypothetical protein [Gemmatimonadota bacterium]
MRTSPVTGATPPPAPQHPRRRESRPETQLALQLGIAVFMLSAGATLVLGAVGLLHPDEEPGAFARVVAFLFGAVVGVLGFKMFFAPLLLLATNEGAGDRASALVLGTGRLLRRPTAYSLASALFLAPLAWSCWRELHGLPVFGWSRETLIDLVSLEFLLIHGFPFFVIAASFARLPDKWPRRAGMVGIALLLALYSLFAWGAGQIWGVFALLYLCLPNVLAFARAANDWSVRLAAISRWVVKIVSFLGVAMVVNERELQGEGNLRVGLLYFGLQTAVELLRVSEIPLDLGAAWGRLPANRRRKAVMVETASPQ